METKITKEEYETVLEAAKLARLQYPMWRWGQAVFNTMYELHPDFANELRGTKMDPFYIDENVDKIKNLL